MSDETRTVTVESLAAVVAAWRLQQHRTTGEKDADEGYAAGLGYAIFVIEDILNAAPLRGAPDDRAEGDGE